MTHESKILILWIESKITELSLRIETGDDCDRLLLYMMNERAKLIDESDGEHND